MTAPLLQLKVLPQRPPVASLPAMLGLGLWRLAALALIVLLIRDHNVRLRIDGDRPITPAEVRALYNQDLRLTTDHSHRQGLFVLDPQGETLGYVVRTQPQARKIIGYSGPTDSLIAFDANGLVIHLTIRDSYDTFEHVNDVKAHRNFLKTFNGLTWDQLAGFDLLAEGVEGVTGATLTSMAIAESVVYRAKLALDHNAKPSPIRFTWTDAAVLALLLAALLMAFTHLRGRPLLRRAMQLLIIAFLGLYSGNLLAQSLFAGWAASGVAWRLAPALALLAAAALFLPLLTRRQIYCSHLCPHGAAQELLGKITTRKLRLRHDIASGLRFLPVGLLAITILVAMLQLPLDLASLEPFDAYLLLFTNVGSATLAIAILSLLAAILIPQAYCKFGCPTGLLLELLRSHGRADRLGRRDLTLLALLALTLALYHFHHPLRAWIETS